jgi:O-antigen ligase
MMELLAGIKNKPLEFIVGVCVFAIALGGGAIENIASTSLAVMFLLSLIYIRSWKETWRQLDPLEKALCYGFALYTLSGALSWINTADSAEFVKQMGRYLRFTLIISVFLMMRFRRIDVSRYLYAGIVVSGFVYLGMALYSLHVKPDMPATGDYHHITFGDAVMLNAGIMVMLLLEKRRGWGIDILISLSVLCALYASFLSESRGAWIVLPVYLFMYITYFSRTRITALKMIAIALIGGTLLMLTPAGILIQHRYDQALNETSEAVHNQKFDTSVGQRFAYWNMAYDVWKKHPLVGTGLGDFDGDMKQYQKMGVYPNVAVMRSTHNIFMQALAGTGIIGFVALVMALILIPYKLFHRNMRDAKILSLTGCFMVLSYAVFGLTESWILRAPVISIYIGYIITLAASIKSNAHMSDT